MQRHRYRGKFPMDAPAIANVITMQCHRFYASIPMNTSAIANVATMQRCGYYTNIPNECIRYFVCCNHAIMSVLY